MVGCYVAGWLPGKVSRNNEQYSAVQFCVSIYLNKKMWPVFVDYTDKECKRALRTLELDAYTSIMNAFRAQGTLTGDRRRMLQELGEALSIPVERHKSEVRRVINDEHLNTVAERLFGPNTITNWAIEGRRIIPLMQRLAPQTAFTEIANAAAAGQAAKNTSLPLPGKTGSREVASGIETMASRKRKDTSDDCLSIPRKLAAMDPQYFQCLPSSASPVREPSTVPDVPMICESSHSPEIISPVSSFSDVTASKNLTSSFMASQSSSSKHSVPLKTPTLSSFDQLTSNLLASRAASKTFFPAVLHEEQVSTVCDAPLQSSDQKSAQKPLSSHSTMKSSFNTITSTPSSSSSSVSSTSSSKDRLQNLPCSSQSNKFLSQIRTKTPTHARQNLPAGLGIKLTPQSHTNQRNTISPKSPIKASTKPDTTPIFKKTPSSSDNPSSNNESISSVPKSPKSKTECQPNAKPQQTTKNLPKTTQQNSQFVSRSLFSTATSKTTAAAKSLSPVIFNVSSPSSTAMQTVSKSTGASQSEAGKSGPHLVSTKSSPAVGLGTSHMKINTSNTQTFHYRNDGGMVRSARIVNISQPVGSRLPCAISPSAISALGLSTNISSTALRVTLPAGSLNTNSSLRVAAAQKPNVIVVHKAQMYPRPSQGGAVIMTSAAGMSKVSNDVAQETYTVAQKQEKSKPSGSKTTSRAIASTRPQSPAVSVTDKSSDAQCKKNLLADIMEASGILLENTARKNALMKEKNNAVKNNKEHGNHQEVEIISQKGPVSSTSETTSLRLSDSNTSKMESANNLSGNTALTVASLERNGVDTQKQGKAQAQSVESQSKDTCNTVVSLHNTNENVTSSSECGSKGHRESTKDDS